MLRGDAGHVRGLGAARCCALVVVGVSALGVIGLTAPQTYEYAGERGPLNWGRLAPAWATCSSGTKQSPIDLSNGVASTGETLSLEYGPSRGRIFNNGHTIEVETEGKNGLAAGGRRYDLVQFHFHGPSEHRVGGRSYEMELHLVHRSAEGGLAVVGVLLTRGPSSNALDPIFGSMPAPGNKAKAELEDPFNPTYFLPERRTHFSYTGSLTTPPCTEGVQWFVLQQPITVSDDDLARFAQLIPFNARPVQSRR